MQSSNKMCIREQFCPVSDRNVVIEIRRDSECDGVYSAKCLNSECNACDEKTLERMTARSIVLNTIGRVHSAK